MFDKTIDTINYFMRPTDVLIASPVVSLTFTFGTTISNTQLVIL